MIKTQRPQASRISREGARRAEGPTLVQRIKDRLPILEYAGRYTRLKPSPGGSGEYFGCCPSPAHDDGSPSFYVSPEKGVYHCKGCGITGNVIQLHALLNDMTPEDAKIALGRELGVFVERSQATWESMMASAANRYTDQLFKKADALSYAMQERGLTEESIRKFGIGFCWGRELEKADASQQAMAIEYGLARKPEGDKPIKSFMAGRMTFPVRDRMGRVVGFTGRIVPSEYKSYGPKYMNTPETSVFKKGEILYGLYEASSGISKAGCAIVVEGNLDVVMLHQAGFTNTVAVMGSSATGQAFRPLWDITDRVVFCLDGDKAGEEGTMRSIMAAAPTMGDGKQIAIVHMPAEMDPDEFILKHGPERFRQMCDEAEPLSKYLMDEAAKKHSMLSPEGRSAFLADAHQIAQKFSEAPLLREEIMQEARAISAAQLASAVLSGIKLPDQLDEAQIKDAIRLLSERMAVRTAEKTLRSASGAAEPAPSGADQELDGLLLGANLSVVRAMNEPMKPGPQEIDSKTPASAPESRGDAEPAKVSAVEAARARRRGFGMR